jgi:hypothetical protein
MNEQLKYILIGLLLGAGITVLVMMLIGEDKIDSFVISGDKGGSFSFKLDSKNINDTLLLNRLWSHDFSKDGMIGWFKRKNYISLDDVKSIGNKIMTLSPKDELAAKIIELRNKKLGPFQILSDPAKISVPGYEVPLGIAYTWKGSTFAGETIEISDPSLKRLPLLLKCEDRLGARPPNDTFGVYFFQINKEHYKSLLGEGSRMADVHITVLSK